MITNHSARIRATTAVAAVIVATTAITMAGCSERTNQSVPSARPSAVMRSPTSPTSTTTPGPTAPATTDRTPSESDGPAPTPAEPGRSGTPRGLTVKIARLHRPDGNAVASAFGTLLGTYDAKIDNSVSDAARRAAALATPGLAAQLRKQRSGPSTNWNQLVQHHAYTTVTVRLGGGGPTPADKITSGVRMVTINVQPHGTNGWRAPPEDQTLLVFLTRSGKNKPWAVSKFSYLS